VRRFLLHLLPKGLMRIRHYGFLANRVRAERLARIRAAIGQTAAAEALSRSVSADVDAAQPFDGYACPRCAGGFLRVRSACMPTRWRGG